jgi:hypothetical protein
MAYKDTYRAFVRFGNGKPDQEWKGLRKAQAQWRYNWIRRNWYTLFGEYREYGWQREWEGAE